MSITVTPAMARKALGKAPRRKRSYKKSYRRARRTIPITLALPLAATFFTPPHEGWASPYEAISRGDYADAFKVALNGWTGFDTGQNKFTWFPSYLLMMIVGEVAHKAVGYLGINRRMAKLPSPLNKLSI